VATGIAVFTYATWAAIFPELGLYTNSAQAGQYWAEATFLLDNTATSPVQDVTQRTAILNLIAAHICSLRQPLGGQPSSPLVGRISEATEGSVTVKAEMIVAAGSAQFWAQSKYGILAWQMTLPFRSARYYAGPRRSFMPVGAFYRP
jgi:hypothetical protein